MTHFIRAFAFVACLVLTSTVLNAQDAATTPKFKILHHFSGNGPDGGRAPQDGLAIDSSGNLYGTTVAGGNGKSCGAMRCGTVFKLAKPAAGKLTWKHSVLHHFTNGSNDGALPFSSLLIGGKGALMGTTNIGSRSGTVFRLTPATNGTYKFSVLHAFQGGTKDGAFPVGDVTVDQHGALYVTATEGGAYKYGVALKLTPPATGTAWKSQLLHSFKTTTGKTPMGDLVVGSKNVLYGTTEEGGNGQVGVLFSLTPPASGNGSWTYKVLHQFTGYPGDGQFPRNLMKNGTRLYGTTVQGGKNNAGTIFSYQLPASPSSAGTYKVLHSFDYPEGTEIYSNLLMVGSSLYGVAEGGGANSKGSVFKFTLAASGKPSSLKVLHSFSGATDGERPYGGLVAGKDGTFYGTASGGGKYGFGAVFSLKP